MNSSFDLEINFEDFSNQDGSAWWWATHLMKMLGYDSWLRFEKVINKAIKACMNLGNVKHYENFIAERRKENEKEFQDFKLSRFACYLVAMNGDSDIPQVAVAQAYFVEQTRKFEMYVQGQDVERLAIREELKESFKTLSSTFRRAGGNNHSQFNNAGLVGMYNSNNWQLAKHRSVEKDKIYDKMGRLELAANLFRITQTEAKIENENIHGQCNLEQAHYNIGREVRNMIKRNTGKLPENLKPERELPEIKTELKKGYKKMQKTDISQKRIKKLGGEKK